MKKIRTSNRREYDHKMRRHESMVVSGFVVIVCGVLGALLTLGFIIGRAWK